MASLLEMMSHAVGLSGSINDLFNMAEERTGKRTHRFVITCVVPEVYYRLIAKNKKNL